MVAFQDIMDADPTATLRELGVDVTGGMNLPQGEETSSLAAIIDEGRLQASLDLDDAAFVDITFVLLLVGGFDVELFENPIRHNCHAVLFGVLRIDKHFPDHSSSTANLEGVDVGFCVGALNPARICEGM